MVVINGKMMVEVVYDVTGLEIPGRLLKEENAEELLRELNDSFDCTPISVKRGFNAADITIEYECDRCGAALTEDEVDLNADEMLCADCAQLHEEDYDEEDM